MIFFYITMSLLLLFLSAMLIYCLGMIIYPPIREVMKHSKNTKYFITNNKGKFYYISFKNKFFPFKIPYLHDVNLFTVDYREYSSEKGAEKEIEELIKRGEYLRNKKKKEREIGTKTREYGKVDKINNVI